MSIMKTKYLLGICALAIGSLAFTSCSDDDNYDVVGNPNTFVFFNINEEPATGMPDFTYTYQIKHTPVGSIITSNPGAVDIYVYSTKNASSDITVNLAVDNNAVVDGYTAIPSNAGIKVSLSKSTVTIPAGSNVSSEAVTVTLDENSANWSALDAEATYVVPVTLTSATGAVASQSRGTMYIGISTSTTESMLNTEATEVSGTAITDYSGWSATYTFNGSENAITASKLFDDNRGTYAYFKSGEIINNIDLGKTYNLRSLLFRYYWSYYTVGTGLLETSVDGVNWTSYDTISWSDTSYERIFVFYAPMAMRYIRFTTTNATSNGTALSDFVAYE